MRTFAITILAVAVLFVPGCYMDMEDESTVEPSELIHSEINADEAATDSLMSVTDGQEAAGDLQAQTFCPTVGQSCSKFEDCGPFEQCRGGKCLCECDPGAQCTADWQCGFAGYCEPNNLCECI